ncbi:hypothetical protein H5P28_08690 [Ruficoccus amylovorans]|uniref:Uncharacterized protein n=1 Tax=Ruficoccus amylovorans TaxID=1804625 RepID=A0A842HE75_9BACT|nr:hypothetical protein [Ruficoccus amylovorans]MBC2594338.1 hypothetical protein [Ruficoccus amylovorans]
MKSPEAQRLLKINFLKNENFFKKDVDEESESLLDGRLSHTAKRHGNVLMKSLRLSAF